MRKQRRDGLLFLARRYFVDVQFSNYFYYARPIIIYLTYLIEGLEMNPKNSF